MPAKIHTSDDTVGFTIPLKEKQNAAPIKESEDERDSPLPPNILDIGNPLNDAESRRPLFTKQVPQAR